MISNKKPILILRLDIVMKTNENKFNILIISWIPSQSFELLSLFIFLSGIPNIQGDKSIKI